MYVFYTGVARLVLRLFQHRIYLIFVNVVEANRTFLLPTPSGNLVAEFTMTFCPIFGHIITKGIGPNDCPK